MCDSTASVCSSWKPVYFDCLVHTQDRFKPEENRRPLLGSLFLDGVAFLSLVCSVGRQTVAWALWQDWVALALGVSNWLASVGGTILMALLHPRLRARFGEVVISRTLFLLGLLLVWF